MKKDTMDNPVYDRNVIEFVTVALEYCSFVEHAQEIDLFNFVDKAIKILPLLYLKASLLPVIDEADEMVEDSVTEEMYNHVKDQIATLLGEKDPFLETFHPDMPYSDTPIVVFISECMADVYQDIGNYVELFKQNNNEVTAIATARCRENFQTYWGQQLLNALKALHAVRFNDEDLLGYNEKQ